MKRNKSPKKKTSKDPSPSRFNTIEARTTLPSTHKLDFSSKIQHQLDPDSPRPKNTTATPRKYSYGTNQRILRVYRGTSQPNLLKELKLDVNSTPTKGRERSNAPLATMHSKNDSKIIMEPFRTRVLTQIDSPSHIRQHSTSSKNLRNQLNNSPFATSMSTQFPMLKTPSKNIGKRGSLTSRNA